MSDTERKPHKWQKEIIAWANGARIQFRVPSEGQWGSWKEVTSINPAWHSATIEFRVKPKPVHLYSNARFHKAISGMEYVRCNDASATQSNLDNIRFTVTDGEVTAVELIK